MGKGRDPGSTAVATPAVALPARSHPAASSATGVSATSRILGCVLAELDVKMVFFHRY